MRSFLSPAAGMWLAASALLLTCVPRCQSWDTAEMELFDLVEEVQENFYRFLGVEQDASSADIRKAYRKMSLILHPDKNKDENAEIQFRQLVAIYEVLKDEEKRQSRSKKKTWKSEIKIENAGNAHVCQHLKRQVNVSRLHQCCDEGDWPETYLFSLQIVFNLLSISSMDQWTAEKRSSGTKSNWYFMI